MEHKFESVSETLSAQLKVETNFLWSNWQRLKDNHPSELQRLVDKLYERIVAICSRATKTAFGSAASKLRRAVVHELDEQNHSSGFWACVAESSWFMVKRRWLSRTTV